jgi:DnaJ-class molecular chaperone
LPPDATIEAVRAAYEEARKKYDPDLVEHLGFDVKEHFAEKSRTVERAYRMLTDGAQIG